MEIKRGPRSKKLPKAGDIFRFQTTDGVYRFGRVIKDNAVVGPFKNAWLIYVYRIISLDGSLPNSLDRCDLLVPPLLINQSPWTKGFFRTICNQQLTDADHLAQHCFLNRITKKYYDEYGKERLRCAGPIGDYSLKFEAAVCETICSALEKGA